MDISPVTTFSSKTGLTQSEAKRQLALFGPNEIAGSHLTSRAKEIGSLLLDPMGLMLLGLSALYFAIGEPSDGVILLVAWIPITGMDIVLGVRANAAIKALKSTLSPRAKVIRDSAIQEILISEIVPGDVLILEEGQSLPADGRLIEAHALAVDEAALTGESVPIDKSPGHEIFAGTNILSGRGLALIEKTGTNTKFGHIARLVESVPNQVSPLKRKVDYLVKRVLIAAGILAVCLFALEYLRTQALLPSLIIALTFGMSTVPEEFPLVFTLYLSLGTWRLARKHVLIKSLPSVEALGSADILCTDKTGTLTEGRFQLEKLHPIDSSDPDALLWQSALMACEPHPVDSMDTAIYERGKDYVPLLREWSLAHDYPFEKQGKHMTHVWRNAQTGAHRTVMKGAVEGILTHCEISAAGRTTVDGLVTAFAAQGKRLLGLAMRDSGGSGQRTSDEVGLRFLGVLVFSDPIRADAAAAIAQCQDAGIEVKMLTGDHPLTAHYIADQAGIAHSHGLLFTGDALAKMDQPARHDAFRRGAIFSRVLPEQKHEMIQTLRANGHVVAMIGDGINDAPALKLADIGISMGHNATDVARSSAQIVLIDSNFSGIVEAMLEGRRILANLERSFSYLLSFHVPVVLLALLPPLLSWDSLLLPVHIIVLQLIVHPISAFTFENLPTSSQPARKKVKRGPHALLPYRDVVRALLSGLCVSIGSLALYRYCLLMAAPVDVARSAAFASVLVGSIVYAAVEVWPKFGAKFAVTTMTLATFIGVIALTPLPQLHLIPPGNTYLALAVGVGCLGFLPALFLRKT